MFRYGMVYHTEASTDRLLTEMEAWKTSFKVSEGEQQASIMLQNTSFLLSKNSWLYCQGRVDKLRILTTALQRNQYTPQILHVCAWACRHTHACMHAHTHTHKHTCTHTQTQTFPLMSWRKPSIQSFTYSLHYKCHFHCLDYNFKIMHPVELDYKIMNRQPSNTTL